MKSRLSGLALLFVTLSLPSLALTSDPPNVLILLADDLGYGDLGCYGNRTLSTPNLDKLASEGVKLTHNLAAYSVCTPSRAAILTGRYPVRSGMLPLGGMPVFMTTALAGGLPSTEITIGDVAKAAGYRTAFLGKWHIGWSVDQSDPAHTHPLNRGFDYFYGVPLSNVADFDGKSHVILDINPNVLSQMIMTFTLVSLTFTCLVRADYVSKWAGLAVVTSVGLLTGYITVYVWKIQLLNSFMFRNYTLVEQPIDLATATRKLVLEGQHFLQAREKDGAPFLLLVSWLHVHTAVVTGPQFTGSSRHGPYGDGVQELDWGVGQLLDTLERTGLDHNTLVYFTSDHGADPLERDLQNRTIGGYNGPFGGSKGDGGTEGAVRVPGLVRWPATIPAGQVIGEPVSHMDLLPTIAELLRVDVNSVVPSRHVVTPELQTGSDITPQPDVTSQREKDPDVREDVPGYQGKDRGRKKSRVEDGRSLMALLTGRETVSPVEFFFHYCLSEIHAIRYRPRAGSTVWKLAMKEPDHDLFIHCSRRCSAARDLDPPRLYDLTSDPTATSALDPDAEKEVRKVMLQAMEDHLQSVEKVPSQFHWLKMLWQPWRTPCCNFPACECQDSRFIDLL